MTASSFARASLIHGRFGILAGEVLAKSGGKAGAEQSIACAAVGLVLQHGEVGHEGRQVHQGHVGL